LRVGQIARRITEKLTNLHTHQIGEWLDPDAVETGGICHDLGHPPFGHIGEAELDNILTNEHDLRFEGNAQSFRTVTHTGVKQRSTSRLTRELSGFDLTASSLSALMKYPGHGAPASGKSHLEQRHFTKKVGHYHTEQFEYDFCRHPFREGVRSPGSTIVDLADDLSYASHDVEDYVRAGMIPLHALGPDAAAIVAFVKYRLKRKGISFDPAGIEGAMTDLLEQTTGSRQYEGRRQDEYALAAFTSKTISRVLRQLSLFEPDNVGRCELHVSKDAEYALEVLKGLTWFYVIESASLRVAQTGHRRIVRDVFSMLRDWLAQHGHEAPAALADAHRFIEEEEAPTFGLTESQTLGRAVADYICTLTEAQVVDLFQRGTGLLPGPAIGQWSP
jgi:dGTPase